MFDDCVVLPMHKIGLRRSFAGTGTTVGTPIRYGIYQLISLLKSPPSGRTKGLP